MTAPRWFSPNQLPKYPGLGANDSVVMNQYLGTKPQGLVRVAYSLPLGQGRPADENTEGALLSDWQYLTKLKVDAILEFTDRIELMEVKTNAEAGAIGQLLCYNILFRQTFLTSLPVYNVILCSSIHPDVLRCAGILNIRIKKVQTPYIAYYE